MKPENKWIEDMKKLGWIHYGRDKKFNFSKSGMDVFSDNNSELIFTVDSGSPYGGSITLTEAEKVGHIFNQWKRDNDFGF